MFRKTLLTAIATAAALAAGTAQAALERMTSGNSAVVFVALDSVGTPASLMVDLGSLLSDWSPNLGNAAPGTTIVWDFNANTMTRNGSAVAGTYNWSAQYAAFAGSSQSAETRYGVIAGGIGGFPNFYLTTGNPTQQQMDAQTTADTTNMGLVDTLFASNLNKGTFPQAGEGAAAHIGSTSAATGYVGATGNFGNNGNWRANLKWNALAAAGSTNQFFYMNDDSDDEINLGGTFSYDAGVLTWNAAPVPEPSTYALAIAGLAIVGFAARRRRAA